MAAFAFLLPWGIWDFATAESLSAQDLQRRALGYALAAGYGLLFTVGTLLHARRRRRELRRWEMVAEALEG